MHESLSLVLDISTVRGHIQQSGIEDWRPTAMQWIGDGLINLVV
jgi:hypothetical protein